MDPALDGKFDIPAMAASCLMPIRSILAALGGSLKRLSDQADSKEMETLISVGKAGAEFLNALVKFQA
ncbi:MAG: hypothetical protein ABI330_00600 [Caldimonas sp.]|nr:hypothetical protein [Pseudomonadota bacterium]